MKKRVVRMILWSLLGIYLIGMVVYISSTSGSRVCKDIAVVIEDQDDLNFLSAKDIEISIKKKFPRLIGSKVDRLQLDNIERFVLKRKTVEECAVYQTISGGLRVSITQRKPFARIFSGGRSYYIDEEGNDFPSTHRFASRVMVVNGSIGALKTYNDLIELIRFIEKDSFWEAQIVQISVEPNGDFALIPRIGDHVIILGNIDRMEDKFKMLLGFYNNALQPQEWQKYSKINIKYEGQVVCTRKG